MTDNDGAGRISTVEYAAAGERRAYALGNRGPLRFAADGSVCEEILNAYRNCGFYLLEAVIRAEELAELRADVARLLERAPIAPDAKVDAQGRPAAGADLARRVFSLARPLSDPVGGTTRNRGRHEVKMEEPEPAAGSPEFVVYNISAQLQLGDSFLRLYGHPQLLRVAEQINGADFTPFAESIFVKQPGLGASVAWHQDGTTHWDSPDLDDETHGFNFLAQLYGSTPRNGLWVVPGSHREGKIDIRARVAANGGDVRLPDAVPLIAAAGDVVMCNRQTLHASFANTSPDLRVTLNFGFHRRASVLGVRYERRDGDSVRGDSVRGDSVRYDEEHIHQRSRMIAVAIDARRQRFPDEVPYRYRPLEGETAANRWNEEARATIVRNYHLRDLSI